MKAAAAATTAPPTLTATTTTQPSTGTTFEEGDWRGSAGLPSRRKGAGAEVIASNSLLAFLPAEAATRASTPSSAASGGDAATAAWKSATDGRSAAPSLPKKLTFSARAVAPPASRRRPPAGASANEITRTVQLGSCVILAMPSVRALATFPRAPPVEATSAVLRPAISSERRTDSRPDTSDALCVVVEVAEAVAAADSEAEAVPDVDGGDEKVADAEAVLDAEEDAVALDVADAVAVALDVAEGSAEAEGRTAGGAVGMALREAVDELVDVAEACAERVAVAVICVWVDEAVLEADAVEVAVATSENRMLGAEDCVDE